MKATILMAVLAVGLAGCGQEFAGGFAAGAVAMKKLADDAQANFITTVNELNAKKAEYQALIDQIDDVELKAALQAILDEQTLAALEELKAADWKDPKVLGGYGLALISMIFGAYQKKKRNEN